MYMSAYRDIIGKLFFSMAEKLVPSGRWRSTFDIVKESASKKATCHEFLCDPNIDGRNL
jgi:hypothetical protein